MTKLGNRAMRNISSAAMTFPRLFVFQERVFMLPVFPVVEC